MPKRRTPPQHQLNDSDIDVSKSENAPHHIHTRVSSSNSDTDRRKEHMQDTTDHDSTSSRKPTKRKRHELYDSEGKAAEESSRCIRRSTRLARKPDTERQPASMKESKSTSSPSTRAKVAKKTKKCMHDNQDASLNTISEQQMTTASSSNHVVKDTTATASNDTSHDQTQPSSSTEEAALDLSLSPKPSPSPTSTQEEALSADQPVDVLSSLIDFSDLDEYTRGSLAIAEALRLNMEMQLHAENQLGWINERIRATQELMQNVRDLSSMEVKMDQKPVKIHKKYPTTYDFFIDEDGNKPPITSDPSQQDTIDQSMSIVRRTWSNSERQRLFDGVHAEARRALVVSIVASKEEHKIWDVDRMSDKELENVSVDKLNWKRISALYVRSRTPVQCIIQWTTQEHPRINKKPWSKAESQKLQQLVEKHGIYGKWELIAKEHGSNRTASQCFSRYQSERNTSHSKRKWTEEDDMSLREAVALLGEGNWQQTASMLGNRTGNQCLQRWMKSINPAIRRGKWTEQEDETLRRAVKFYGVGNWNKIQQHLPGRTDMQARERWTNILDPSLTFTPFTAEEEERLYALIEEHGRKWSMLTQFFPGRTDNHLLRFWKTAENRKAKAEAALKAKRKPGRPPKSSTKGKEKASS